MIGSSNGVVVNLLACAQKVVGSIPGLASTILENWNLLLPSRDMTEILLKSDENPQQSNPILQMTVIVGIEIV